MIDTGIVKELCGKIIGFNDVEWENYTLQYYQELEKDGKTKDEYLTFLLSLVIQQLQNFNNFDSFYEKPKIDIENIISSIIDKTQSSIYFNFGDVILEIKKPNTIKDVSSLKTKLMMIQDENDIAQLVKVFDNLISIKINNYDIKPSEFGDRTDEQLKILVVLSPAIWSIFNVFQGFVGSQFAKKKNQN